MMNWIDTVNIVMTNEKEMSIRKTYIDVPLFAEYVAQQQPKVSPVSVYTDGATVGHNGRLGTVKEIGIGIYIPEMDFKHAERMIGISNNEAEFHALIAAMLYLIGKDVKHANFYMDSMIVRNRAARRYIKIHKKAKSQNVRMDQFQQTVIELSANFEHITFNWIPREKNETADFLSKQAVNMPSVL